MFGHWSALDAGVNKSTPWLLYSQTSLVADNHRSPSFSTLGSPYFFECIGLILYAIFAAFFEEFDRSMSPDS